MKVDLIYSGGLNAANGLSSLVRKLKDAESIFAKMGVEQRVISAALVDNSNEYKGSIQTEKTTLVKRFVRTLSSYSVLVTYMRLYRSFISPSRRIVNYYKGLKDKGSIVVFHDIFSCYAYLNIVGKKQTKVILVIHGNGMLWSMISKDMPRFDSLFFRLFREKVEDAITKHCDRIGFDADLPRHNFCERYNIKEAKTFYAYNGLDERPYPQRQMCEKLKIICIASINTRKNQEGIIDAMGMLPVNYKKKIELTLVGDGDIRSRLEDKAQKLTLKVEFTGTTSEEVYYKYLLDANCFCLFSKDEGLPIAVLEGMRAGLPVIGSRVAGIPEEIIDGKTGFLVNVDVKELSERFKYLIDNLHILSSMGEASYQYFLQKFTTGAMVKKYVEVYNS